MPTGHREAIVELLRKSPVAALHLLRRLLGVRLPRFRKVRAVDASMRELKATEHRADFVLMLDDAAGAPCAIVVFEEQRKVERLKLGRWPRYLAVLHDGHKRSVVRDS